MTGARPPAPWAIREIDLASPPPEGLERPEGAGAILLLIRYRGAPLARVRLTAGETPMSAGETRRLAAEAAGRAVAEWLSGGAVDRLAPTPAAPRQPREALAALAECGDVLDRLEPILAARRAASTAAEATIAVCTRGRPQELEGCLRALEGEIAKGREVIVVDNGPDAETARVAARRPTVRYAPAPRGGLSAARNVALEIASGDVVAFVDDDARPEPGWLAPLLAAFDRPCVAVVCGFVRPERLDTDAQIAFETGLGFGGMGFLPLRFDRSFLEGWRWGAPVWNVGAGANMAVRRLAALGIGGFDERLGPGAAGGCGDDSEFWRRALHHGYELKYEPLSVSHHRHRVDLESLRRQARGYGLGHVTALFAQYAYARDPRDLARALVFMPIHAARRALRAGADDPAALPFLRGVLAGLGHVRLAARLREQAPTLQAAPFPEASPRGAARAGAENERRRDAVRTSF